MSASELFFSGEGRIGRGAFWLGVVVLVAALALYDRLLPGGVARLLTAWLVKLLLVFCGACVLSKRLHDRGLSGWRAVWPVAAFALAWPEPRGVVGAISALVLIWYAVQLGVGPGRPMFNRYGPPPGARPGEPS